MIKDGAHSIPVDVRKIFHVSMDNNSPVFFLSDGVRQKSSKSLNTIADDLRQWIFLMLIHKSHIANLYKVKKINKEKGAKISDELWLPVARDKYDSVEKRIENLPPEETV